MNSYMMMESLHGIVRMRDIYSLRLHHVVVLNRIVGYREDTGVDR